MPAFETPVAAVVEFFPDQPHFMKQRPRRLRQKKKPPLTIPQILAWADGHFERTGQWPRQKSGEVLDAPYETWRSIDHALTLGLRGLSRGTGLTLALLLAQHRGARHQDLLPKLSIEQILAWADEHFGRTGQWPRKDSGEVHAAPGETWSAVNRALFVGRRGLPASDGLTLARLLAEQRNVPHPEQKPPLTIPQILAWADAHCERTGTWPVSNSGAIFDCPDETWAAVDHSLREGLRGQPGGSSLPALLAAHRGRPIPKRPHPYRNRNHLPRLTTQEILAWADAYYQRTGRWPTAKTGPIPEASGETWLAVIKALSCGCRGLPGGSSLARLLNEHRPAERRENIRHLSRLTVSQIRRWVKAHFQRTGKWPTKSSGPVVNAPGETWNAVYQSVYHGLRGLPSGLTMTALLAKLRGKSSRSISLRRRFTLEYWQDGPLYVGRLLELPGVFSQGKTVKELLENIQEAYELMGTQERPAPR